MYKEQMYNTDVNVAARSTKRTCAYYTQYFSLTLYLMWAAVHIHSAYSNNF